MNRFTTDKPNGNTENALNLFYTKDSDIWVRGGGSAPEYHDVRLVEYVRDIARKHSLNISLDTGDEDLCDELFDILYDGTDTIEGIVATLNTAAWAFAALRERLKAYEDTGLTPEEVENLQAAESLRDKAQITKVFGLTAERVHELAKADAEGRLIVLPVKEGTKVWRLLPRLNSAPEIKEMYFNLFSMQPEDFGKTIFLTRGEAEAALAKIGNQVT